MKLSDKVLLGLYLFRSVLNDELKLEASELAWLLEPENEATDWRGDNGPKKLESSEKEDYLENLCNPKSKVRNELSSLSARRYVSFVEAKGFDFSFRVQLLSEGMLRAEKLNSRYGRIDLFYLDNKNGFFGVILTVLVSAIISLVTTLLSS